ncbi:hypothetical protein [Streptomyces sp. NPDC059970]|uniref:hypothetical protein n=1 Tax=Streptomyces sp. NPDC059970 TaxID=3347019 RepID=UPI0036C38915
MRWYNSAACDAYLHTARRTTSLPEQRYLLDRARPFAQAAAALTRQPETKTARLRRAGP